jgi:hypothetical protein
MMTNLFLIIKKKRERENGIFISRINNDLHTKKIDDPIQSNSFSCISKQAKKNSIQTKRKGDDERKKNCTDVYKALYDYVYYCVARRYLKEKKRTEGGRKINE